MASRALTIHLYPDEPITALWCETCQLPSGIKYVFRTLGMSSGVGTITRWVCQEDETHRRSETQLREEEDVD